MFAILRVHDSALLLPPHQIMDKTEVQSIVENKESPGLRYERKAVNFVFYLQWNWFLCRLNSLFTAVNTNIKKSLEGGWDWSWRMEKNCLKLHQRKSLFLFPGSIPITGIGRMAFHVLWSLASCSMSLAFIAKSTAMGGGYLGRERETSLAFLEALWRNLKQLKKYHIKDLNF